MASNKELLEKLQRTELQLQRLTDAIEIKDRELSHLRQSFEEFEKHMLGHEQLNDRYECTILSMECVCVYNTFCLCAG